MDYKFVAALLGTISVAGAAIAADPVRTAPPSAGPAKSTSNRDHIDQDAQTKTQPTTPTTGVGGSRLSTGGLNTGTGTITNNGTINDKR